MYKYIVQVYSTAPSTRHLVRGTTEKASSLHGLGSSRVESSRVESSRVESSRVDANAVVVEVK